MDDSQEIEKFNALKNMPSILSSTLFKNFIQEKFFELVNRQRVKVRSERDNYLLKEIEIIKKKIVKGQKRT